MCHAHMQIIAGCNCFGTHQVRYFTSDRRTPRLKVL